MNKNRKIIAAMAVLTLSVMIVGCSNSSGNAALNETDVVTSTPTDDNLAAETASTRASINTAVIEWDQASAVSVTLSGTTATADGEGVTISDNIVTITEGGTYVLSGEFTGSIIITTPADDEVNLVLNGVDITADTNAAIYCSQASLLTLILEEGTENTVTDAADFTYTNTVDQEPDAAIFSKGDLTIQGTGSLTVNASYNNGIGTKDDLIILNGNITVTAANHGLRGRDSVAIVDGTFDITAAADGIQSNNDEDTSKGWIVLTGGTYTITAGNDAVQAETTLEVSGGIYSLTTGGGSETTPADTTGSYKGLKAAAGITVSGGTFTIDSADDTIHSNDKIAISGGSFTLSSGDDAVHADGDLTISGAATEVHILTSYEGLEAKTMTISDGVIVVNSSDDGINIAGGNDSSGAGGRFGTDSFAGTSSTDQWLLISGGTITVQAGSDAIDINGSGEMTGGTVDLTAALLGEGQTLDVDANWTQSGGDLTETGGTTMDGGMGGGPGGGRGPRERSETLPSE